MKATEVIQSIRQLTAEMIAYGLSEDQNFPLKRDISGQIQLNYAGFEDVSIALRNINYHDVYHHLESNRQYNLKLIDGGLVQFLYTFSGQKKLLKHRLCYFPTPSFEPFQNDPELYLDASNYYADMISRSILPVPIRFDFDPQNAVSITHPASHLTLGQYKNCRIPCIGPLCPATFLQFILVSFYNTAAFEIPMDFKGKKLTTTITAEESKHLHISFSP